MKIVEKESVKQLDQYNTAKLTQPTPNIWQRSCAETASEKVMNTAAETYMSVLLLYVGATNNSKDITHFTSKLCRRV